MAGIREAPGMEPWAVPVPAEPLCEDAADPCWGWWQLPHFWCPHAGNVPGGEKIPAGAPWSPFPSALAWGCRRRERREGGRGQAGEEPLQIINGDAVEGNAKGH